MLILDKLRQSRDCEHLQFRLVSSCLKQGWERRPLFESQLIRNQAISQSEKKSGIKECLIVIEAKWAIERERERER